MTTNQSRSIFEPFKNNRLPVMNEILATFQLIKLPSLLVDISKQIILTANQEFLKLSGYSANEMASQKLRDVFEGEIDFSQLKIKETVVSLISKSKQPLQLLGKLSPLGMESPLAVISLSVNESKSRNESDFPNILHGMNLLLGMNYPVWDWLRQNIDQISKDIGARFICTYMISEQENLLEKMVSTDGEQVFSRTLPLSDLARLNEVRCWEPGKRVITELHRVARIHNLLTLAVSPISLDGKIIGIFIIGSEEKKTCENYLEVGDIYAKVISTALALQKKTTNLQESVRQSDRWLEIYSQVFDNSQEGICCLTPEYKIIQINSAAEWMLGYSNWEVKDQPIENVLIGPRNLITTLDEARSGIAIHNIGDAVIHHRDGHSFPAQIQIFPVQKDETTSAILIFFRDISEHEQIIARTQQLEHRALLGDVTSVFAHEVRNPINNISTGLQLLSTRLPENDPNLEVINRIQNDCVRLNDLMESVLAFSRPVDQKFENIDLGGLLHNLVERWRPRMTKVNVTPFYHCDDNVSRIYGNYRSLEQVFINLISNALDAMNKDGGTLAVKISQVDSQSGQQNVEVTVSDSGPGIPEEIQKKLFEPFVTNKPHGTGLGLAITKKIVSAHHGDIQVESFPGGTIFHVIIPAVEGGGS